MTRPTPTIDLNEHPEHDAHAAALQRLAMGCLRQIAAERNCAIASLWDAPAESPLSGGEK